MLLFQGVDGLDSISFIVIVRLSSFFSVSCFALSRSAWVWYVVVKQVHPTKCDTPEYTTMHTTDGKYLYLSL